MEARRPDVDQWHENEHETSCQPCTFSKLQLDLDGSRQLYCSLCRFEWIPNSSIPVLGKPGACRA